MKKKGTTSPSEGEPRRFGEILKTRQREAGKKRKGERTRDRLKLAAVKVLGEVGFRRLRVADICKRANVSAAAFYLYFDNKEEITVEVLTEFLNVLAGLSHTAGRTRTLYEALYETNLQWIGAVRANAGLMRCLLQLSDETPEFKQLNERSGHDWFLHVTRALLKRFPEVQVDERALLLAVYAMGGMMDELSRRLLVSREPHLISVVDELAPSDEALAEFLSLLWYRALFGATPPVAEHPASRELLRLSLTTAAEPPDAKRADSSTARRRPARAKASAE